MRDVSHRFLSVLLAIVMVGGTVICPCLGMGKGTVEAAPARSPSEGPGGKCDECRMHAKKSVEPKTKDRPASQDQSRGDEGKKPCPKCEQMNRQDRSADRSDGPVLKAGVGLGVLHPMDLLPVASAIVIAGDSSESVPIPPLLHDLVHISCQLTI